MKYKIKYTASNGEYGTLTAEFETDNIHASFLQLANEIVFLKTIDIINLSIERVNDNSTQTEKNSPLK